jgi:hypothetical protein
MTAAGQISQSCNLFCIELLYIVCQLKDRWILHRQADCYALSFPAGPLPSSQTET